MIQDGAVVRSQPPIYCGTAAWRRRRRATMARYSSTSSDNNQAAGTRIRFELIWFWMETAPSTAVSASRPPGSNSQPALQPSTFPSAQLTRLESGAEPLANGASKTREARQSMEVTTRRARMPLARYGNLSGPFIGFPNVICGCCNEFSPRPRRSHCGRGAAAIVAKHSGMSSTNEHERKIGISEGQFPRKQIISINELSAGDPDRKVEGNPCH